MACELQLFVLWSRARRVEERILADLRRETNIRYIRELRFEGDWAQAYRSFYGPSLPDERRKVAQCGTGPFLLVIVEDNRPEYGTVLVGGRWSIYCNRRMNALKQRYQAWSGRHHRVHCTQTAVELDRDVRILTGHGADEWRAGVPEGAIAPELPGDWCAVSSLKPFAPAAVAPGTAPALEGRTLFLEHKYINDAFYTGMCLGLPAIEKVSTKAVWSIGNEYRLCARMHTAASSVVPRPLVWRFARDGKSADVVTERMAGPSLTELLAAGVTPAQADGFAVDILTLARALKEAGIVHRDLFADNLLLGEDGHLKAIDWQLAIDRNNPLEDPWVVRNWKFRYVVFGVNRELGLGVWNDYHALGKILAQLPQTAGVKAAMEELAARAEEMTYADPPNRRTRVKLWFYALSLRVQMLLRGRRHRKYAQLERRWRTIKCRWDDVL